MLDPKKPTKVSDVNETVENYYNEVDDYLNAADSYADDIDAYYKDLEDAYCLSNEEYEAAFKCAEEE